MKQSRETCTDFNNEQEQHNYTSQKLQLVNLY